MLSCGGGPSGGGTPPPAAPVATTTVLTSTTSTPAKGSNDTFTATVSGNSGTQPSGTVQFTLDGATSGSPIALNNASAQLVTSFTTAGAHTVSATYSGDASHQGSTSSTFNVTVPYTSGSVPGTYQVTITAASGIITHTAILSLNVQ